ncbi:MAG: hypothetical protein PHN68_02595 [Prolixibacteraceae bacterium]|nr:hypothetical protein [Prolixibacteraceae bacterium]
MIISNKKRTIKIRRIFFLVSVIIAIGALILFLLDHTIYGLAFAGFFALWFLFFQTADYQYIEFSNDNNKILLRFYKIIRFGKTEFNSIEFPQKILYNANFENSVFGKLTDLTLIVKTQHGIAEYPQVSLTALSLEERRKIRVILFNIVGR